MKTQNIGQGRAHQEAIIRGWVSKDRAGGTGITVEDGTTTVNGIVRILMSGGWTVIDNGDGTVTLVPPGGTEGTPGWANVKDFGAVGDGVTNDTTPIQDAIDAVCVANGGIVYFPTGTYAIATALDMSCDDVTLLGDGPEASTILAAAGLATGNMVNVSGLRCQIRDLLFTSTSQKTGGIGIYLNGANNAIVDRVRLNNQYDAVKVNGGSVIRIADTNIYDTKRHGIWVTGVGNDLYLSRLVADNSPGVNIGNAILLDSGFQAIIADHCDMLHFTNGLLMQPSATSTWHFFDTMIFDTNSNDGIHLGGGAAQLYGVTFVDCWSASNTATGVYFGTNVQAVQFLGGKVLNNGQHGFSLDATSATRITIADNVIVSNSQSASGTYSAISVKAGTTHLTISGNQGFNGLGLGSTQKYGVDFETGATDYLVIDGNDFSGNTSSAINNLSAVTGTHRWQSGSAGDTGWSATTFWRGDGTWATPTGGATALDTTLWRPLLDGSGNVVADGSGQAVMAFGAA